MKRGTLTDFAYRFHDKTTQRILILRPTSDWLTRWKPDSNLYAPTQIEHMSGHITASRQFGYHNRF